ncbi:MAG: NfeD family protein [Burkholderiaceae bacterium]|nr:MAG: NfeD family protein [Burkholderiaceae bacterium]
MQDSTWWFVVAFIVLILELLTGTFYLLVLSVATACAGLAALLGAGWSLQLLAAAVVGAIGVFVLRRTRVGKPQAEESQRDPNVNLDIGQTITVDAWKADRTARVMYRGAAWDVELAPGQALSPGQFRIAEMRGSRLIVEAAK